jgi:glyceraldehyde 3-phosphate dehydrogenase
MVNTKIGINGFGRIGRQVLRNIINNYDDNVEVVAINDLGNPKTNAHLFKYDSTYGKFKKEVIIEEGNLVINGKTIKSISEKKPEDINWGELGVEIIIESTGIFTDAKNAKRHLENGGEKVIISAPATGEDITIVMGINHNDYDPIKHSIISNASCTTNCVALMLKVLHENFGIDKALMSTIHAYTNDQSILDQQNSDLRRARAAGNSIIPTSTGAAKAVTSVIPELLGKIDGMAYRVPVITGSVTDLTVQLSKKSNIKDINESFKKASENELNGFLDISMEPLVSSDYIGSKYSCTIDGLSTSDIGDGFIKVVGWYDNEWAYARRVADLSLHLANNKV